MSKTMTRSVLAVTLLACTTLMPACIGPSNASRRLHTWNREIENRWVGAAVYIPFRLVILTAGIGDLLLFNSLEFWGFENWIDPVSKERLEALRKADAEREAAARGEVDEE